jgi:hypothetical protein
MTAVWTSPNHRCRADGMTTLWHILPSALLMAWLASSISWFAAGAAISSWAGRPIWIGAVVSGLMPVFGALLITGWAVSGRRAQRYRTGDGRPLASVPRLDVSGSDSFAGGPFGSSRNPVVSDAFASDPFASSPFAGSPFASSPFGDEPFGVVRASDPLPSHSAAPDLGWRRWVNYLLFPVIAAGLATGFLLSLLSGDWAEVSTNLRYGTTVDAWDLGLGQLLVVSAVEFAIFVPLSRRRRTRWPAVLAVFTGCWWGFLCWIAYSVTDALQQLLDRSKMVSQAGGLAVSAGWIWMPMTSLAFCAVLWGGARLAYLHRIAAPTVARGMP